MASVPKKIILQTMDGETFEVDKDVALQMQPMKLPVGEDCQGRYPVEEVLFDLILAANYLDIKGLLDLTCQTVADMIKGKTPEEIRKTFNTTTSFTPEEEEEVRRENAWAFE
ncbi:hypothetical protein Vadar_024737 [Vaccinium darrowii]|uniref:Uncharacterized protein n=1 Tax=Vaccinium darrowii TaxID=229202 RepID=A0ACB7Y293_9ERIC|nr:hypothetical protein Vadar_024737 [Vaccinium darrowii]